jgi:hypothetical protein
VREALTEDRAVPYGVRELPIGGVLDHTLYLLRDNWRLIAIPWLVFNVPVIAAVMIAGVVMAQLGWFDINRNVSPMFTTEINYLTLGHTVLNFVISGPLTAGAVIYGLGLTYMGRRPAVRDCIVMAFRKWAVLFTVYLIAAVAGTIGIMMCIIPGILIQLFLFIAPAAAALETSNPFDALKRSAILMRGNLMPAFVLLLVVNLLAMPFTSLLMLIPQFETSVLVTMMFATMYPVLNLALITVYYASCRARQESLDLDLMANAVQESAPLQEAVL